MTPPRCTIIIPARLASTRFPGKVLAAHTGRPLVQHVVDGVKTAPCAARVVVAADDPAIAAALRPFGTEVVLTAPAHPNGTSRLAEAVTLLGLGDHEVVVNAQGDEPELTGAAVEAALRGLYLGEPARPVAVGTVAAPLHDPRDVANPNIVKVVRDRTGRALYFSRAPIPVHRDARLAPAQDAAAPLALRHLGLYAYRVNFLRTYAALAPTPLERAEQLEQLRVLEHGFEIGVELIDSSPEGIDTPEQYEAFVKRWRRAPRPA